MSTTDDESESDGVPLLHQQATDYSSIDKQADEPLLWRGFDTQTAWRHGLFWLLCVISGGVFWMLVFWLPHWKVRVVGRPVGLYAADTVVVARRDGPRESLAGCLAGAGSSQAVCRVHRIRIDDDEAALLSELLPTMADCVTVDDRLADQRYVRAVDVHFRRHVFDRRRMCFVALNPAGVSAAGPLRPQQRRLLARLFGANDLLTPVTPVGVLLLREMLHPFYLFQVFAIVLWILIDYWTYSIAIVVGVLLSTASTVWQLHKNELRIRRMARFASTAHCLIACDGSGEPAAHALPSAELVPGDVVVLSDGQLLPCDLHLIDDRQPATTVLVNEALLTGESTPVSKSALEQPRLYGGTTTVQVRPEGRVRARVLCTGFDTAKGELVRSIVLSPPSQSATELTRHGFVVLGVMVVLALLGVAVNSLSIPKWLFAYTPFRQALYILDILTIAVPPVLPMALSVGATFALHRLRKQGVVCTSPPAVNVCGQIELVCFDKTGTLTADDLKLSALIEPGGRTVPAADVVREVTPASCLHQFLVVSSCHALARLDNGQLVGDPLELRMFEALAAVLDVRDDDDGGTLIVDTRPSDDRPHGVRVQLLKRYAFDSALQRMSCVVRVDGRRDFVLMKGSQETVVERFCRPADRALIDWRRYTSAGYRVLAAAVRPVDDAEALLRAGGDDEAARRAVTEAEGQFQLVAGLVFENPIKDDSPATIAELQRVRVRSVMITGDHPETALYTARACNMLPAGVLRPYLLDARTLVWQPVHALDYDSDSRPLSMDDMTSQLIFDEALVPVVTGAGYDWLQSTGCSAETRRALLARCNVWSRMKPEQKQALVRDYQRWGVKVAMVGDGSNDCSALKQADVGLSLSAQAEATMAAPFTSRDDSPRRVLQLLREGRAALTTSFALFRYIVYYSSVQYTATLILYWYISKLGDYHYLLQDLLCVAPLAVTMAYTPPRHRLSVARPPGRILSALPVTAMLAQCLLQAAFQVAVLLVLLSRDWYSPTPNAGELGVMSYAVSALFQFSFMQTTLLALVVSVGRPFRQEFWRNAPFSLALAVVFTFAVLMMFGPLPFKVAMEVREMPLPFEYFLLALLACYALIALGVEVALGRGVVPPPIAVQYAALRRYETI